MSTPLANTNDTCKTGETCIALRNSEFLTAVFHGLKTDADSYTISFSGNPNTAPSRVWASRATDVDNAPRNNNFFAISSFIRGPEGNLRRRKSSYKALHAIMLDDIGTKVDPSRISLPPSWEIETSTGNFQVGYILKTPIDDAKLADNLVNALIALGLCDKGANGPTTRVARLPVGCNGKYPGNPATRLTVWDPKRQYNVSDICDAYNVDLDHLIGQSGVGGGSRAVRNDVFIPASTENPVIPSLIDHGLYKTPLGDGKHDISCPWLDEHTDSVDHGTCYFEPDDKFPLGGFKCLHSHGDQLHLKDLLEYLGVDPSETKVKPTIRMMAGELDKIVETAEKLMANTGQYFQFGGVLVGIHTDYESDETSVIPLKQKQVLRVLCQLAYWERSDRSGRTWVISDPADKYADMILSAGNLSLLPVLRGIVRQPYFRPDGSIVKANGYDPETMLYGVFDPKEFDVPEMPTRGDAEKALGKLKHLLEEVAFATESDMSAALAAILTASIRPSLPTAPGFHTVAHSYGSGKSFLNRIISAFATPQPVAGVAFPGEKEEMNKTLIALLIKSPGVINFDDLNTDIKPSESLKMALTEEYIGGRLLGVSKDVTCSTRALFLFSGNNVYPVNDMARRVLCIHLDPQCESPVSRVYQRPNLESEVRKNRGAFVSAALTIIKAWHQAGKPITQVKPIASYSEWALRCRQPLLWLGLPDPVSRLYEQIDHDPDKELLGRILAEWIDLFGERGMLIRDVVRKVLDGSHLYEAFAEIADDKGSINRNRLGWWIKKHAGQIVNGLKLERVISNRSAAMWKVVQVSEVLQGLTQEDRYILGYDEPSDTAETAGL